MIFKDSGLKDKVVIVTGGNGGIGQEIVKLIAGENAHVIFFYYSNHASASEIENELKGQGLNVTAIHLDIQNNSDCVSAIEKIYNETAHIDILVNNSAVTHDGLFANLDKEKIQNMVNTNILGTFFITQAVLPLMIMQRSGKIINISSVSSDKGGRGQAVYAATKGAINAWTKALACELASRNINVNAVAPGVIETDMSQGLRERAGDEALSKILLKRFGKPVEVAYAVLFLASKYADYITGEILHVDGGFKMG